jgi:hypothetical protein
MPRTDLSALPDTARLWIFTAERPIPATAQETLLREVDAYLETWAAHGAPLICARDLRERRFLAIAVDEAATGASGCSIDGLFRTLARVQPSLGVDLLSSGRIAWRSQDRQVMRDDFEALAVQGVIAPGTPVFNTLAETVGAWRHAFEQPAHESWVRELLV